MREAWVVPIGGNIAAESEVARMNFTLSPVPRGQFQVLARLKVEAEDAADYDHMSFGVGWSYGNKTKAPSAAAGEYYECAANDTFIIIDLGLLNLPPIIESDISTNSSFELRLYVYANQLLTQNGNYKWQLDYVFLLPVDEGLVISEFTTDETNLVIDGITDPPNVFIVNNSNEIKDYPIYVGAPFRLGRESTRIYLIQDEDAYDTCDSYITYQPQFLVI